MANVPNNGSNNIYQTFGELCLRMNCSRKRMKRLIFLDDFPAILIGGQYVSSELKIQEWLARKIDEKK